jgi:3-oxoacyl-[acyl-carrier-protein] synthase II
MKKRVVITSFGVISSLGDRADKIMANFHGETVSFARPSFDDEVVVSPIRKFSLKNYIGQFKNSRYLTRGAQLGVASAVEAFKKANLDKGMTARCGLFVGTGPNMDISGEFPDFEKGELDAEKLNALWMLRFLPNTMASAIAQLTGLHGENSTIVTACAASLHAIGEAFRKIRNGNLALALAGGGESRINPVGILGYKKARALSSGPGAPEKASRPFNDDRSGFVPGEGGAFFLLEDLEHARMRKADIYGEICGFGNSLDGETMTAPGAEGVWAEQAIRSAFREAGVAPADIDLVCTHGTGTYLNDAMEHALVKRIYGAHKPFLLALKSWIGHSAAACGAVEMALLLICMQNGYLPEIRNLNAPCADSLNFVREPKAFTPRTAVIQNFGFGGQNCALVIKPWKE